MRYEVTRRFVQEHFAKALDRHKVRVANKGKLTPRKKAALKAAADFALKAVDGNEDLGIVITDDEILSVFRANSLDAEPSTSVFGAFRHEYATPIETTAGRL
ncbi:hypothetical protein ABVF61_05945 [Roseibium sp. HPY-6]|uniref:hypothetical protein n=1 Tax=Roseibium sp. HPY-6 TaxID=3229852 RepID=UPI00338FA6AB